MAVRYVTKYGLTQGILKVDGALSNGDEMLTYRMPGRFYNQYAHGLEFHETLEEAQARVAAIAKATGERL